MAVITVEPVDHRTTRRRFREVPFALHREDPRWRAPVRVHDEWLTSIRRHPYFAAGDGLGFLARRDGRPCGRIVAHVPQAGDAKGAAFGALDADDDPDTVDALLDAAKGWLADLGARSMQGPWTWSSTGEVGAPRPDALGPVRTGRGYLPAHLHPALADHGGRVVAARRWWRLDLPPPAGAPMGVATDEDDARTRRGRPLVAPAGRYGDRVLAGLGLPIVPDVADALHGGSMRDAWATAKRLREPGGAALWYGAPPPDDQVAGAMHAVAARGYRSLVVPADTGLPDLGARPPWAQGATLDAVHEVFEFGW